MFIRCEHTCAMIQICSALSWILFLLPIPSPPLPFCPSSTPCMTEPPHFYLLGDPFFGDRGANVHPLSSLVSDQLPTPCSLTLPHPSWQHPSSCYMFTETTSQHQLHCLIHKLFYHYAEQRVTDNHLGQLTILSSNVEGLHLTVNSY
jgi:hypothetical protein